MTFTYPPEEYMELLEAYNELESMTFSPEDSRETVISKLAGRSAKKREIADKANAMVREYAETFEKDPAALTAEAAEALQAFLERLFPKGSSTNKSVTDHGVMLRIARLLLGYYRQSEDWDLYANALHQCGLMFEVLINRHNVQTCDSPYIGDVLELARRLEAGELSENARNTVMKMLPWTTVTSPEHFPVERYRRIVDILRSQRSQPPTEDDEYSLLTVYAVTCETFYMHGLYAPGSMTSRWIWPLPVRS